MLGFTLWMTDTLQPISKGSFAFMTDTSQERAVVIASYLGTGGCWRVFALECHRPFTQQASQAPWKQHFNSVGETKAMKIKLMGPMGFCPVSQYCHFISPSYRDWFRICHNRFYDKFIKKKSLVFSCPTHMSLREYEKRKISNATFCPGTSSVADKGTTCSSLPGRWRWRHVECVT